MIGHTVEDEMNEAKGHGKDAGVGPTYNVPGAHSSSGGSGGRSGGRSGGSGGTGVPGEPTGYAGPAPTALQTGKNIDPDVLQPKGANLKEDTNLKGKHKYPEIGTEDDPARAHELKLQKTDAVPPGVSSRNDMAQGGDSKFSGLGDADA